MEKTERDQIIKQGAEARANNKTELDNPYYHQEQMPASTGETVDEWQAKAEAWRIGWTFEDAIRPQPRSHHGS